MQVLILSIYMTSIKYQEDMEKNYTYMENLALEELKCLLNRSVMNVYQLFRIL